MASITFTLPDPEEEKLRAKAKSLGVPLSVYLRTLISDSYRRDPAAPFTDLSKQIRALIPTLAEAFGVTQGKPQDQIDRLSAVLLARFEKER